MTLPTTARFPIVDSLKNDRDVTLFFFGTQLVVSYYLTGAPGVLSFYSISLVLPTPFINFITGSVNATGRNINSAHGIHK